MLVTHNMSARPLGMPPGHHPTFLEPCAYIMEILNLDELAKDQAYEFLFVLGPLLLRGGIGVPVNPIAIR